MLGGNLGSLLYGDVSVMNRLIKEDKFVIILLLGKLFFFLLKNENVYSNRFSRLLAKV